MIIILLGPPGSGKGTQADFIQKRLNIPHLSTGDILRKAIKDRTELGITVEKIMANGELVSDEVILNVIRDRVIQDDCKSGFILDGYPRNIKQAKSLNIVLEEINKEINKIILLDVNFDSLKSRISSRNKENTAETRADDTSEVLIKRVEEYKNQTAPLENYYKNNKNFNKINGMESISDVSINIENFLDIAN